MINRELATRMERMFQERQRQVFQEAMRCDANETFFLERQIVELRKKIFVTEFLPTIARSLVPMASDIGPYQSLYAYGVTTEVGAAKIGSYMANDIPRVDASIHEVQGRVVPIVAAFGWNIGEMQEAARIGVDLDGTKMRTCRSAVERGLDQVLAIGTIPAQDGTLPALAGIAGLVNNADVVTSGIVPLPFLFAGTPPTPSVILAALSTLVIAPSNATANAHPADTLLLPTAHYNYLQQTPFSTLSGDSILTVFRKNNPQITTIAPWWRLDTAGAAGIPRAVAYKKDPEVLEGVLPLDFTVLPPEIQGFETIYNCHARSGGVKIYRPYGVKYGDFATS